MKEPDKRIEVMLKPDISKSRKNLKRYLEAWAQREFIANDRLPTKDHNETKAGTFRNIRRYSR